MPLTDNTRCRETLKHIFPGIEIESNLKPSGQRLVYFCRFSGETDVASQRGWSEWGNVALKISEDVHPTVIARLEKERELLNGLNSPYFPRLMYSDVFSSDPVTDERFRNRLFVTIEERIAGLPLDDCMARFAAEKPCAKLLARLVEGLQLLWSHPQRIVHRDLKPQNIIIKENGSPVIIDLGIVREEGTVGVTASHGNIGPCTPAYASPEQLKNQKRFISFKSDFFSLGVIAYELLAGESPFVRQPNEPLDVVVHRVLTYEPPSLLAIGRASRALSCLVEKLIAKEPYMRPRTVADLGSALGAILREV